MTCVTILMRGLPSSESTSATGSFWSTIATELSPPFWLWSILG